MRLLPNQNVDPVGRALPASGYLRTWTYTAGRGTSRFHIELDATDDCAALIDIELMLVRRFLETPNPVMALIPSRSALGVLAWHAIHQYRFGVIDVGGDVAPVGAILEQVAYRHGLTGEASSRLIAAFGAYRERAIDRPSELPPCSMLRVRKEYRLNFADGVHRLTSRLLHK
jgi:hypothetical protein